MRVGRAAIDEDAIRLLEQHNPDVQFDWTRILKQPVHAEPQQRHQRPEPRPERQAVKTQAPAAEPPPEAVEAEPVDVAEEEIEASDELPELPESDTADERAPNEDEIERRPPVVLERIGAEGLARLRARYAEVMARIADRPMEEPAREELKLRAERLNPDAWVTDDEVREGLEQYESVFESLRSVVGHPRRRRRRRPSRGPK